MTDDGQTHFDYQACAAAVRALDVALAALGIELAFGDRVMKRGVGYSGPGHLRGLALANDGSPRLIIAHKIEDGAGALMHIYTPAQIAPALPDTSR